MVPATPTTKTVATRKIGTKENNMWNQLDREQKINEIITCVAFVAFVVLLCFMPDLTRG